MSPHKVNNLRSKQEVEMDLKKLYLAKVSAEMLLDIRELLIDIRDERKG